VRKTQTVLYKSRWRCTKQPQAQCAYDQTSYIATMLWLSFRWRCKKVGSVIGSPLHQKSSPWCLCHTNLLQCANT